MWNTRATREKAGGSVFIKKKKKKILLQGQHVRVLHKLFIWLCAANYIMLIFYVHFTLPYLIFSTSPFSLSCSGHPNTTSRWKKKKIDVEGKKGILQIWKFQNTYVINLCFLCLLEYFIVLLRLPTSLLSALWLHLPTLHSTPPPPPPPLRYEILIEALCFIIGGPSQLPQHLPTLHAPPLSILFHRYFFYWYNVLSRLVHSE